VSPLRRSTPSLVWFRRDLRLADNAALRAAVAQGGAVIPVFVWAPEEDGEWAPGAASRWWLHHSLERLGRELRARGSRLVIRQGRASDVLCRLARETGARHLFWNRVYEPAGLATEERVSTAARAAGVEPSGAAGALLHEPGAIRTTEGRPFQVFTPFWGACVAKGPPPPPTPAPRRLRASRAWPRSLPLASLRLLPRTDWAAGLRTSWKPGEAGGLARLRAFARRDIAGYARDRDRPAAAGVSRLSPHLHFGEISPRQAWHAARAGGRGVEAFRRELGWREFAQHLLFHFPATPTEPLRPRFRGFDWADSPDAMRAWQRGLTGYPLVDAGMRQLWRTGWMHNRVRMVVASFLVKDLLLPWQLGAKWFWDTLVDADLANNTLGWQWSAGCGADAAPFFRIFNPATQGKKFDPEGEYVRAFVPELRRLPARWIHEPWRASSEVRARAGVELGVTYPEPIVDHTWARGRALDAFAHI
jgi:deoxyribodipyrimidine photo-lyase